MWGRTTIFPVSRFFIETMYSLEFKTGEHNSKNQSFQISIYEFCKCLKGFLTEIDYHLKDKNTESSVFLEKQMIEGWQYFVKSNAETARHFEKYNKIEPLRIQAMDGEIISFQIQESTNEVSFTIDTKEKLEVGIIYIEISDLDKIVRKLLFVTSFGENNDHIKKLWAEIQKIDLKSNSSRSGDPILDKNIQNNHKTVEVDTKTDRLFYFKYLLVILPILILVFIGWITCTQAMD